MSEGSAAVATPGHTVSLSQGTGFALYGATDPVANSCPMFCGGVLEIGGISQSEGCGLDGK